MMTGDFTRNADFSLPAEALKRAIRRSRATRRASSRARLATALLGDAIATNLFMVGVAYRRGLLPVSAAAIERAIELNRVSVDMNKRAFLWGRRAAHDPAAVAARAAGGRTARSSPARPVWARWWSAGSPVSPPIKDAAYANRYRAMVERVRRVEEERAKEPHRADRGGRRYYFKLLAYKDEYEVARLYTSGEFLDQLRRQLEGQPKLRIHLAPPWSRGGTPVAGRLRKRAYTAHGC